MICHGRLHVALACVLSIGVGPVDCREHDASTAPDHLILLQPDLDARGGAESMLWPHSLLTRWEDDRLGTRWSDESAVRGKALGLARRLARFALLDVPVDYFTVVLLHEFWGHGGRYREFDIDGVDYGFDLPPPYGDGGGHASVNLETGAVSDQQLMAVWTGGFEVQQLLQRSLRTRWVRTGHQHHREASLYFWSLQIAMNYVGDTSEELAGLSHFNDPQAYVYYLNFSHGYTDPDRFPYTVADLKRSQSRNALDPFVYLSLLTQMRSYLWSGYQTKALPMIRLGPVRYLPALHTAMSPFGVETKVENYLRTEDVLLVISLNRGDETFNSGWGGVGVSVSPLWNRGGLTIDSRFEIWRQPRLGGRTLSATPRQRTGGLVTLRLQKALGPEGVDGVLELGYKTSGFLEGYVLAASPIMSVGARF